MKRVLFLLSLLWSAGLAAQTAYTRILLPLQPGTTHGAFGAQWRVQTWVYYAGAEEAQVIPTLRCCCAECPSGGPIDPGLPPFAIDGSFQPTIPLLVHVEARFADAFTFASRVTDVSRTTDTAGTAVPVVREESFRARPVLLDVPVRAGFRTMLRLYALPEVVDPVVDIRYFRQPPGGGGPIDPNRVLLRTDRVALRWFAPTTIDIIAGIAGIIPPYTEVPDVQLLPGITGEDAVWIEVVPVTPGLRLWAFASPTNNATQQVTIITP